jgi:hypothetical protein
MDAPELPGNGADAVPGVRRDRTWTLPGPASDVDNRYSVTMYIEQWAIVGSYSNRTSTIGTQVSAATPKRCFKVDKRDRGKLNRFIR